MNELNRGEFGMNLNYFALNIDAKRDDKTALHKRLLCSTYVPFICVLGPVDQQDQRLVEN